MAFALFTRVPELDLARYDRMMYELDLDVNPPAGAILHIASEVRGASMSASSGRPVRRPRASSSAGCATRSWPRACKEPLSYRIEPLHNLFAPDMDMIGRIGSSSLPVGTVQALRAS